MHAWSQCVEDAADLQQAQHLVHELGQRFSVGETAVHVGNDLKFSKLLEGILAQTPAGEISYAVIAEARGQISPTVGPTILDGHRDGARLLRRPPAFLSRGRGVLGYVVVQYRLPGARADIEPSVRAAKIAERVAEAGGEELRVVRKPSAGDVAARNVGAPAAVDFFLLGDFLVELRRSGLLRPASSRLQKDDDQSNQTHCTGLPACHPQFYRAHRLLLAKLPSPRRARRM